MILFQQIPFCQFQVIPVTSVGFSSILGTNQLSLVNQYLSVGESLTLSLVNITSGIPFAEDIYTQSKVFNRKQELNE